jgi:hypothetical protein
MRTKVREAVSSFIQDLRASHLKVIVEILDANSPEVDAQLRVKCATYEQMDEVAETIAHLTTKYYLDEGVYIETSTSYSGPIPSEIELIR